MRSLIARGDFEPCSLNEARMLDVGMAGGGRTRRGLPALLSRRIGFPRQNNAVFAARLPAVNGS